MLCLPELLPSETYPEMNMSRTVLLLLPLREVEPTSTSRTNCSNKKLRDMFLSRHATLDNDLCNYCLVEHSTFSQSQSMSRMTSISENEMNIRILFVMSGI